MSLETSVNSVINGSTHHFRDLPTNLIANLGISFENYKACNPNQAA